MKNQIYKLDIRPPASIYGTFSRLSYKPAYAIAEFVDNSTQSFYENERTLKFEGTKKLEINIEYDKARKKLTITDNAFGMDLNDFKRAILLGAKPDNPNSRNEFGMGLKTAASWFGNVWSVKSTRLGDDREYFAVVDIPKLEKNSNNDDPDSNSINILSKIVEKKAHYTQITIKQLTKEIRPKDVAKLLSSTYRRDFKRNMVKIRLNGQILSFDPYSILEYKDKHWEKNVKFAFTYNEKIYNVDGSVGIINPGSFNKAGFALFRRNRVIIGGEGQNYKPNKIFGQAQSQISLKLIGELNLDDFEVNQAKDGFIWDGGLEDAFLVALKENIQDYIDVAELSKGERTQSESINKTNSEIVYENVNKELEKISGIESNFNDESNFQNFDKTDAVSIYKNQQREMDRDLKREDIQESEERVYENVLGLNDDIHIKWSIEDDSKDWLKMEKIEDPTKKRGSKYFLRMNLNHPFFKPYANEEGNEFKIILEKLAIAISLAELQATRLANEDGNVHPNMMIKLINDYLTKLGKKQ